MAIILAFIILAVGIMIGVILLPGEEQSQENKVSIDGNLLLEKLKENLNENTVTEDNTEDYFLSNSDGKYFFENVLCGVTEITATTTNTSNNEIVYEGSNNKYYIEVCTTLNNEIKSVTMIAYTNEDNTNFFIAATRLKYDGADMSEVTNYIVKNIAGNYNIKYIGNAKFKYTPNRLEITAVENT